MDPKQNELLKMSVDCNLAYGMFQIKHVHNITKNLYSLIIDIILLEGKTYKLRTLMYMYI